MKTKKTYDKCKKCGHTTVTGKNVCFRCNIEKNMLIRLKRGKRKVIDFVDDHPLLTAIGVGTGLSVVKHHMDNPESDERDNTIE